jgi:anti-anti-sigma factor
MSAELLELTVVSCRGVPGVVRVEVTGAVDAATAPVLGELLRGVSRAEPVDVQLDLSGITFFSYAALEVLLGAREQASGRLALTGAARPVWRLLHVLGLEHSFGLPATQTA